MPTQSLRFQTPKLYTRLKSLFSPEKIDIRAMYALFLIGMCVIVLGTVFISPLFASIPIRIAIDIVSSVLGALIMPGIPLFSIIYVNYYDKKQREFNLEAGESQVERDTSLESQLTPELDQTSKTSTVKTNVEKTQKDGLNKKGEGDSPTGATSTFFEKGLHKNKNDSSSTISTELGGDKDRYTP